MDAIITEGGETGARLDPHHTPTFSLPTHPELGRSLHLLISHLSSKSGKFPTSILVGIGLIVLDARLDWPLLFLDAESVIEGFSDRNIVAYCKGKQLPVRLFHFSVITSRLALLCSFRTIRLSSFWMVVILASSKALFLE